MTSKDRGRGKKKEKEKMTKEKDKDRERERERKERSAWMHTLEQHPIPEELEAPVETPKTVSYVLMRWGFLVTWSTFDKILYILAVQSFFDGDGETDFIDRHLDKFLTDKAIKETLNDAESQMVTMFVQALKTRPWPIYY